jgi:predicted Zn finger-like uncharacterized protein
MCGARYDVDDSSVPKTGMKVRCSRCHHVFSVTPEEQEMVEDVTWLRFKELFVDNNQWDGASFIEDPIPATKVGSG